MGDQGIGILARRQESEAQRMARFQVRQRHMGGAQGGGLPGLVAVEGQHRLGRGAPQHLQLILGESGAQGGHGMGEPGAYQRDHIHIAFGQDDGAGLDGGGARGGKIVEVAALGKEGRLAGVDVFRLGVGGHAAPAERDHPPAPVGDGKEDAVEEEVAHRPAILSRARQTGLDHLVLGDVVGGEVVDERVVAGRRITQAELFRRRAVQAAAAQIVARGPPALAEQLRFIEHRRQFDDLIERFLALLARLVFGRPARQFHPGLARQLFHSFGKAHAFGFHQPFEGVAALAAAETFVEPPLVLDLETGRFFRMERAAAP